MTLISLPSYYVTVGETWIGHFQHFQYITDNICWIKFLIHAGCWIGHFQHFQYITDNICWIKFLIHAMNEA